MQTQGDAPRPSSLKSRLSSIGEDLLDTRVKEIGIEELSPNDAVVVLMGPTGSGKSTFIEKATGITGLVGHSLQSGTNEVSIIRLSFPELVDSDICFVDTPGFNHSHKSDVEVLKLISDFLNHAYKKNIPFTGLLYFHPISDDTAMPGSTLTSLRVFERLCGKEFKRIVLTTTMWDEVDKDAGVKQEDRLKCTYWHSLIISGSSVQRFFHTRESAFDVLAPIFDELNDRHALLLQQEMIDLGLQLKATTAGRTLYMTLGDKVSRHQDILRRIRRDLRVSKVEPDQLHQMVDEYQQLTIDLRHATDDTQKMKISTGGRIQRIARGINWKRLFKSFPWSKNIDLLLSPEEGLRAVDEVDLEANPGHIQNSARENTNDKAECRAWEETGERNKDAEEQHSLEVKMQQAGLHVGNDGGREGTTVSEGGGLGSTAIVITGDVELEDWRAVYLPFISP